jgi:hypothetical protein
MWSPDQGKCGLLGSVSDATDPALGPVETQAGRGVTQGSGRGNLLIMTDRFDHAEVLRQHHDLVIEQSR